MAKCHRLSLSTPALLCCWESWSPKRGRRTGLNRRKDGAGGSRGHVRAPSSTGGSKPCVQGTYAEWMVKAPLCLLPACLAFLTQNPSMRQQLSLVNCTETQCPFQWWHVMSLCAQFTTGISECEFGDDTLVCSFSYSTKVCTEPVLCQGLF